MKLMFITALVGTMMSAAATNSFAGTPVEEAKKEAEVQLYLLSASWNEFRHANDAITNSNGNHAEIEADYQYFYNELNKDSISTPAEKENTLRKLKKTYAQNHKKRAAEELDKQKRLVKFMQQRLAEHQRQFKAYRYKYKKLLRQQAMPEVTALDRKLQVSATDLNKNMDLYNQTASQYNDAYEKIRKGWA